MQTTRNAFVPLLGAVLAGCAWATPAVFAQETGAGMTIVVPGDKQWEKSKVMPYGMKVMWIYGDPSKPGPYLFRIRVPTGYKIPPLKYPDDRVTTVLKGIMWSGEGERYDPMKMKELEAGTFSVTKAGTPHFQWARTELVLQVMGFGPIDNPVTYMNPDDDPRTQ